MDKNVNIVFNGDADGGVGCYEHIKYSLNDNVKYGGSFLMNGVIKLFWDDIPWFIKAGDLIMVDGDDFSIIYKDQFKA